MRLVLGHFLTGIRATIAAQAPVLPAMTLYSPPPETSLDGAFAAATLSGRPAFIVIYDAFPATMSDIAHKLGYFVGYPHIRQALQDAFTVAVLHRAQPGVAEQLPDIGPLEEAVWFVLNDEGHVVLRGDVYGNPKDGEHHE